MLHEHQTHALTLPECTEATDVSAKLQTNSDIHIDICHVTHVPNMTYNVFGGTLNLAQLNSRQTHLIFCTRQQQQQHLFRSRVIKSDIPNWQVSLLTDNQT